MRKRYDAVVIGGGQAGLAMGRELVQRGLDTLILEASPVVGSAWRGRWDSLRLFTPAGHSALPGLPFPGDPDHHPTRDEVVRYLEAYVTAFDLPVALDEPVRRVGRADGDTLEVRTDHGRYLARNVVVAIGPFQRPRVPALATLLPPSVHQLHSSEYRSPDRLPAGPVLVVGGGNSGVQIAAQLAATHPTTLAVGSRLPRLPLRLLGRSIFDWLSRAGMMDVPVTSRLGRHASGHELLIGDTPRTVARKHGVRPVGRVTGVDGASLTTADGERTAPTTVVWATGYRSEWPWLQAPVLGPDGRVAHERGATSVPGLFFLGLPWLHTRGSALLGWVGRDAHHLAERITARTSPGLRHRRGPAPALVP